MTENRTKYMRDYQNFRGELIIKAEMIYGVICKENLKEFQNYIKKETDKFRKEYQDAKYWVIYWVI